MVFLFAGLYLWDNAGTWAEHENSGKDRRKSKAIGMIGGNQKYADDATAALECLQV